MDFVAAGIVLGFSIYEYYKDKIHDNTQTKILSLPRNKKDVVIYRYGGTNPGNLTAFSERFRYRLIVLNNST